MSEQRGSWGSKVGFILAAAGSAVGLGNIWKFPYITGENGGGLFVLIYLVCIALVGVPIMVAEIMIGRAAQRQPIVAFEVLQEKKTPWGAVGWIGLLSGFIILSFYIVVAGWAMDYTLKSVVNFSAPMAAKAQKDATVYRAATSVETMRETLAKRRAEKLSRGPSNDIRKRAPQSVWKGYERYKAAVAKAKDKEHAKKVLFEDERLRSYVTIVEGLEKEIAAVKQQAAKEAADHYKALDDRKVRDEAEVAHRRKQLASSVGTAFGKLITDGWTASFWAILFMFITILVVGAGVSGGIERLCTILMPVLGVLMLFMVLYGLTQSGAGEAYAFVFKPDASRLKASGVLEALGHAFFTLSLGMGAMMTYGSYQKSKDSLFKQSFVIAGLDTGVALLACMMIFPITFSYGQPPAAGPGLVFKSMPLAFAEIGQGGMLLAILFFGLLVVAALTSAVSLLEVVASYFIDQRGWSRFRAAWILGGVTLAFGLPSAFAFDPDFALESWNPTYGSSFFDTMDYLASNWMLPLGGLLISIYAGWVMPKKIKDAQLDGEPIAWIKTWLLLIRYVAPVLVTLVLLQKVGILDVDEILFMMAR